MMKQSNIFRIRKQNASVPFFCADDYMMYVFVYIQNRMLKFSLVRKV